MKRIILFLWIVSHGAFAQDQREVNLKYNLFKGDFMAKNYERAFENWLWCFENAPKLTVNIYKLGYKLLEEREKNVTGEDLKKLHALRKQLYDAHIKHFPKNLPKVYSDYSEFLFEIGEPEVVYFEILDEAYQIDPAQMGVKAIGRFFTILTRRNKDKDVVLIFRTYDQLMESVGEKMDNYQKKLDEFAKKEEKQETLSAKEKRLKKAYEINSRSLGKVEKMLDKIIADLATCDRLIPFYKKVFKGPYKNDPKFLKSAISKMYKKECTDAPLYGQMVEAYVTNFPTPEALVFYAGILLKKGQEDKAKTYFEKAVQQEEEPYKKAKYLFKVAQIMRKKKAFAKARKYAYEALKYKRSMGDAYLLIARMYAKSANSCGKSEFEKRMVYVAAMQKAEMALKVDPVLKNVAKKYVKSYKSSAPSKKDIFTEGVKSGSKHKIGCWIQETVTVP